MDFTSSANLHRSQFTHMTRARDFCSRHFVHLKFDISMKINSGIKANSSYLSILLCHAFQESELQGKTFLQPLLQALADSDPHSAKVQIM